MFDESFGVSCHPDRRCCACSRAHSAHLDPPHALGAGRDHCISVDNGWTDTPPRATTNAPSISLGAKIQRAGVDGGWIDPVVSMWAGMDLETAIYSNDIDIDIDIGACHLWFGLAHVSWQSAANGSCFSLGGYLLSVNALDRWIE